MTIGRLAKAAGVNIDTIRYYERHGLLPRAARRESGYREYAADDVARLSFIRRAKELGFSLADIARASVAIARPPSDVRGVKRKAEERLADVERKIDELKRVRRGLKTLIDACPGHGELATCPIVAALSARRGGGAQVTCEARRTSAAASAIDPVCGMTVDPRTAVSFEHGGATHYFCCDGCRAAFAANPADTSALQLAQGARRPGSASSRRRVRAQHAKAIRERRLARGDRLDVPDASRDPPRRAGRVPDLRHGARAARADGGGGRERGARRHDAPLLDRRRAHGAAALVAMLAEFVPALDPMRLFGHTTVAWAQLALATPVVIWCGCAVLRARLAVDRQSQPEHVHADRARHGRCVALSPFSRPSRRARCRRRSAARAARRRSTSSLRP